jgi:hypothetical protein
MVLGVVAFVIAIGVIVAQAFEKPESSHRRKRRGRAR